MVQNNWITTEMGPVYNVHEQWPSISKFYQWMSEQKDFHSGAAECKPTQWNAWRLVRGFEKPHGTELHNLSDYTRLYPMLGRCQIPWFLPSFTNRFWNFPPNHNAWVSRKPFLNWNPMPTPSESHTGRIMFNWLTKILRVLDWCWAYLTVLTEGELCLDFQWSHNNSLVADKTHAALFYWTH